MDLLQRAMHERCPFLLVREQFSTVNLNSDCSCTFCSSSSVDGGWASDHGDEVSLNAKFEVHLAFPFSLSGTSIIGELERAGFTVSCCRTFSKQEASLLIVIVDCCRMDSPEKTIREVIVKSIQRSKSCRNLLRCHRFGSNSELYVGHVHSILKDKVSANKKEVPNSFRQQQSTPPDIGEAVVCREDVVSTCLIDDSQLQLGQRVAKGSSGVIYEGMYKGEKVAVKALKSFRSSAWTGVEFCREIVGLLSCQHKNLLHMYGVTFNRCHGLLIITKFMEEGCLHQYLQRRQKLDVQEVIQLALGIAEGMSFLHSRGIVHRDLKSANVLLDEKGNVVIGDLGNCCLWNEEREIKQELGSYRWMAPEVFADESRTIQLTPQSDVYSFGILLWELVTCKLPYADYTDIQAAVAVVMNGLRPSIPEYCFPPLRYIIEKCWSQNPSDRPKFTQIVEMLKIISKHCRSW
eukprot:c24625_g1_i1 orf=199-1584(-)